MQCIEEFTMSTSHKLMARQTSDAQLVFRAEREAKVELEAIAAALDRSAAKLLRDMLAEKLPELRKRADEEIRKREGMPHGVTQDLLERELESLLRRMAIGGPVQIEQQDLLAAESKALWVFLSYIWGEHPTADERAAAAEAILTFTGGGPGKSTISLPR